ncbi:MAG: MotA/TolQ/ExbB proton channel family protein [Victivallales bacterium]|jgi:biopolymer transport protein ExbB/TolQ|nr:MotA/TolQ/ExbB proton channel family protein [Victivallales bacterium]MBO7620362.1 MotA/TolQ/ExbB proton channel family protein [Victivallales bacterium]
MSNITQILNWISSSLLLPVTVLLLIGLACALVSLGGFFADSFILLKERKQRRKIMEALRRGEPVDIQQESGLFCERVRKLGELEWDELECEKIISEWDGLYERRLERSRFLAKVGPMLGLMGTLIPMGPALAGLASGDIASMAYNMQIAFATTVLGCCIAGISILVLSVRKHDYADEIACLQYVLDRHQRKAAI